MTLKRILVATAFFLLFAVAPSVAHDDHSTPQVLSPTDGDNTGTRSLGRFGHSLVIRDRVIAAGSPGSFAGGTRSGAVYVHELGADRDWHGVKLQAGDGAEGERFGAALALSGNRLVVGAPRATVNGYVRAGAVYVFERVAFGEWVEVAKLTAADAMDQALFGYHVSIDGDRIAVGAPQADSDFSEHQAHHVGAAYVFHYDGELSQWQQHTKFSPPYECKFSSYGRSASISGDRLAIGWSGEGEGNSVYLFEYDGVTWQGAGSIHHNDGSFTGVGYDLILDGETLVVPAQAQYPSVVHVYEQDVFGWNDTGTLSVAAPQFGDFGAYVSLAGDRIAAADRAGRTGIFRRDEAGGWLTQASFDDLGNGPVAISENHLVSTDFNPSDGGLPRVNVYKLQLLINGAYHNAPGDADVAGNEHDESGGETQNGEQQQSGDGDEAENATNDAESSSRDSNDKATVGGGAAGLPLLALLLAMLAGLRPRRGG